MQRAMMALVLVAATAALATGCTYTTDTSFPVEFEVAEGGVLHVETFDGAVTLTRDPNATRVHGAMIVRAYRFDDRAKARAAASRIQAVSGGTPAVREVSVALPAGFGHRDFDVSFDLFVPPDVTVAATTNDAPILVDGLVASNLTTSNGQVELRLTAGDPMIRTSDGPVVVDGHRGALDIRTSFAPVDLRGVAGDVRATTTNGAISCEALPDRDSEIILSTANGGVEVSVPYDWAAQVVATTTAQHSIFIEGLEFYPAYDAPGQLEGNLWNGLGGLLDVRTSYSDIVLRSRR